MFGCGDSMHALPAQPPARDVASALKSRVGRLLHMAELRRDALDAALTLTLGGTLGVLGSTLLTTSVTSPSHTSREGRIHVLPSDGRTVRLGVFDSTLPDLLEVESGDVVVYPDTWSHFLNRLQPGVSIDDLGQLRREHPGVGPHSIVGPVGVRGAEAGDLLTIHFQRLIPVDWGATFFNPGDLRTGTLFDEFSDGHVRYLSLDLASMTAELVPGVRLPLAPFQGTIGVAPAQGGVVSSVPPGQHAGNIDLRELSEGSTLYVPVWQHGAKLFTGDSHATQGDGEVNNQALESAMREVRIQVMLHKQAGWSWPMAETATHWIMLGIDADLNEAVRVATRNTIDFLVRRARLSRADAYCLASIGVSFRVTQFVNQTRGIHALIPKALFSEELRNEMRIAS
ncbi:MAG TPA: acetamidase/formamidase family protein [Chloroflexota bacterium]|nr:acetamidase/formamidase family protein [Chloroflexota bacterium]